eukprot:6227798-Amphidinium_carterae.1
MCSLRTLVNPPLWWLRTSRNRNGDEFKASQYIPELGRELAPHLSVLWQDAGGRRLRKVSSCMPPGPEGNGDDHSDDEEEMKREPVPAAVDGGEIDEKPAP